MKPIAIPALLLVGLSLISCTASTDSLSDTLSSLPTASDPALPPDLSVPWSGDLCNWMAWIDDNISLSDITIPGTHDSGAIRSDFIGKFSQCQSLTVADQLSAGVRFLDIRLKLSNGSLDVYHGIVDQQLDFATVRTKCKEFLAAHPSEVILLCIKQEDDSNPSFPSAVQKAIEEDPDLWYTENAIPTLGEVRGKIVLFRRYGDSAIGINCADGWADNTEFSLNNGVPMQVQDYYSLDNAANIDVKWQKISALCETATESDNFCLNFTSGYTGMVNITEVSDQINPRLMEYMSGKKGAYGTFVSDFITPELTKILIAANFPE